MKKKELENRIKELERELSNLHASKFDVQKSLENEQRFHNLIEQSIYPILIFKGEDMILNIANDPMLKIFNVGKEALGKPFLDILPEMKDQPFMGLLLDVLHNDVTHYGKEQPAYFERENGVRETIYFNFVYHPHKENDGIVSGVIVNATDVTELVLARQKAEESEAQLRSFVMQAPLAIAIYKGKEYMAEVVNERALQMLSKGIEFVGKPLFDVLPELETQGFKALIDTVMQSGTTYYGNELAFNIYKNNISTQGFYNFVIQQLKTDNQSVAGTIVVATDVTEQVLARKKVEESEHRYHNLVYTSPYMIAIFKGKYTIIEIANDAIIETWGKGKDIFGKSLFEVLPEAAEQGFDKLIQNVYETGEPYHAYETPVTLLRNGKQQLMHYNFIYQAQRNVDGEIVGVAILANEVTPQALLKKALAEQREIEHKALKSIEESNTRYYTMLMQSPFAFSVMKGKDMVVTLANDLMKQFWGKGMEVEGKTLLEILPELQDQPFPEMINQVFITGQPIYANEILAQLQHNEKLEDKYFNIVYQPHYEADNSISGVTTIAYEVTEMVIARKNIEQSETHFRLLADLMPAKISNASADGGVTYFNQHWLNFSGYNFEELRDFGYHQIMHPDEIVEFQTRFQNAATTLTDLVMEMRFKNTEGDYIWHLNIASPIKDENGHLKMWIGVTTDISEQIKTRETNLSIYEKHANELKHEKELAELATLKAEEAVKFKQQFLSNMSHEIRTPLNSILGFTNVLMKTALDEKQRDFVQAIKTSSHSLTSLINDILDLAKVDAGKMTFVKQPFDIQKSIKSILHSFDLKLKEKNLELVSEYDSAIPSIVVGDSVRLNQIILNLMSNAVKFTHKGKIILSVKILSEDEENISIQFTISDTGIGIAENKIDSIFNIFEQAEIDTSNSYGGTGLGLAIVKQLVEFQGGSISASSKIGVGSTFSFILPFGKTTMQIVEEVEILKLDSTTQNVRVLVAEDVTLNQLLIKMILSDFGFEHEVVNNGKMAIEKLQTNTYDIILMDLQMPEMNGFEATEYIRNTLKSNIPIIALTADVTTADVAKCKEFGMNDYVSKPIIENLLYSKIVELVKKATIIID